MGGDGITKLILDALVLVMLAVTVFYAGRLSLHLKNFRDSRKSLEGLLERLSENIDRADRAIAGMREVARDSGAALHEKIKDAQSLADELQVMQEAGNNLAGRLEKLADRNSLSNDFSFEKSPPIRAGEARGFAIRDTEFERDGLDDDSELTGFSDDAAPENFASRAEQELFEALQRGGGKKSKGFKGLL
jgi:hypothetical protein